MSPRIHFLAPIVFVILYFVVAGCSHCEKFIKYQGTTITVEGLAASLPDSIGKGSVGKISIDKEKYRDATQLVEQLDFNQYNICETLNKMKEGPERARLQTEYTETLIEIYKIINDPESAPIILTIQTENYDPGAVITVKSGGLIILEASTTPEKILRLSVPRKFLGKNIDIVVGGVGYYPKSKSITLQRGAFVSF